MIKDKALLHSVEVEDKYPGYYHYLVVPGYVHGVQYMTSGGITYTSYGIRPRSSDDRTRVEGSVTKLSANAPDLIRFYAGPENQGDWGDWTGYGVNLNGQGRNVVFSGILYAYACYVNDKFFPNGKTDYNGWAKVNRQLADILRDAYNSKSTVDVWIESAGV